jgi:L-ascorbate oxidase
MQNNGTSIHWHGMRQLGSNDQDGVNGITECPLAPGDSKTYTFQATEYGTTWYHSHFSAQYGDGVQGPIIIHGPASANYDEEIGTIQVNEIYNLTTYQEDYFAERQGPPTASNYLLNGQNVKPDGSTGQRPVWTVKQGKKYLFRFINTSVDNHFKLMIDNHVMTVIQTDFVPINPYNTTSINIGIGKRPFK